MSEQESNIENVIEDIEIVGTFKPSPKGFGFVMKDNQKVLLVNYGMLKKTPLFNGDIVKAKAKYNVDESRYKIIELELLDTPKRELIGTCVLVNEQLHFMPELSYLSSIPLDTSTTEVKEEDRLKIKAEPSDKNTWLAKPLEVFGNIKDKNIESTLSIAEYEIPTTFSQESLDSVESVVISGNKEAELQLNRVDYTNLPFVTIDGEHTMDVDDAILVDKLENGNFKLKVAIADVDQYIKKGTSLDNDAYNNGTSVYFIQGTKHMLPRRLSENACSLLPKLKRAALVVEMEINKEGVLSNIEMKQAWIESKHKLTYAQVTEALSSNKNVEWMPQIKNIKEMYDVLLEARIKRGALPIRSGDTHYSLDDSGKIVSIEKTTWHIAYGLVEEAMLAANTGVAKWMMDNNLPGIYRHHKGPDLDAWSDKKEFFDALGIDVSSTPSIWELNALNDEHKEKEHGSAVESVIRSTMKAATYITDKTSHYSLAYEWYTHFTSPIRRYIDREVHHIIKAKLNNQPIPSIEEIDKIAAHCTKCDQRAKQATRSEEKRLKVQYASQYIGQTTSGVISGGTKTLIFLKDDALMIEGGSKLPSGWEWNKNKAILADNENHTILMGSSIPATLSNVDTLKWKIEYTSHLELLYPPKVISSLDEPLM